MVTTDKNVVSQDIKTENNSLSIKFGSVLDIGSLEKQLSDFFEKQYTGQEHLTLDLKECVFIEVVSLVRIISLITARKRNGLFTQIDLPKEKDVRDFMRLWKFPEALEDATNLRFYNIVVPESRQYFGENNNPDDLKYRRTIIGDGETRLLSKRFFCLLTKSFNKNVDSITATVLKESKRWEDELVKSVLKNHLTGPENYVSSRIIYEAMSNACRHPNCSLIQVASRFEYVPNRKDTTIDHFTIVVWDDGESLVNTLKKAIEDGVNVRASSLDAVYCFKTKYVDTKGSVYENEIKSDFTPAKGLEEHEILISSLLPGITRDPSGKDHIIHKEIMEIPELSTPGMGLFILINAAIDVFGGSVAFRTSRFFMNVKAPSDKEKREEGISYRAKVVEYSEKVPSFMGNMITIRLPIKGNN